MEAGCSIISATSWGSEEKLSLAIFSNRLLSWNDHKLFLWLKKRETAYLSQSEGIMGSWSRDGWREHMWKDQFQYKLQKCSSSQFDKGDTSTEACLNLILIVTASGTSWNQLQYLTAAGPWNTITSAFPARPRNHCQDYQTSTQYFSPSIRRSNEDHKNIMCTA